MNKNTTIALSATAAAGATAVGVWLASSADAPVTPGGGPSVSRALGTPVSKTATLPGGSALVLNLQKPGNGGEFELGATVPVQGSVLLTGAADGGVAAPAAAVVYALDVSRSSVALAFADCGGDMNRDRVPNTLLDCEVKAFVDANKNPSFRLAASEVGVVTYGASGAGADVGPEDAGVRFLTTPGAGESSSTPSDIESVLRSVDNAKGGANLFSKTKVGAATTSYGGALSAAGDVLKVATRPRKIVIMVSDGKNGTIGPSVSEALGALPAGTRVFGFALGKDVTCDAASPQGNLNDIAAATGGSCVDVPDPGKLGGEIQKILPVPTLSVNTLTMTIDGQAVELTQVTPTLPAPGNAPVTFQGGATGGALGSHTLCVKATAEDTGGAGDVEQCVTFEIVPSSPGTGGTGSGGVGGTTGTGGTVGTGGTTAGTAGKGGTSGTGGTGAGGTAGKGGSSGSGGGGRGGTAGHGGTGGKGGSGGTGGYHVCQCRPEKCTDCTTPVNTCMNTTGCKEIVQCVQNDPNCNQPSECTGCESGKTQQAKDAARALFNCFGQC